ncbi:hypothetical protein [Methylobacterium sp. JK268]
MTFEWIGLATVLAGFLCLAGGRRVALTLFPFATLLGAAAASVLTALGSANLQPAHLLLGFLILIALRRPFPRRAIAALAWPLPGFWLLITALYGALAAAFVPRLMEGATYVFTVARTDTGPGLILTPLAPVSGNLTQTAYFIGDLVCFCVIVAFTSDREGKTWLTRALLICGVADIAFGALDYVTFMTGTAEWLSFMRNATYRMLDTAEVIGIKRLVGSFPEASAYAAATLFLFAFSANLWLNGYPSRLAGPLALCLLAALLLSTSTTAYASVAIYGVILGVASLAQMVTGRMPRARFRFLVVGPLLLVSGLAAIGLSDTASATVWDLLDQLVLRKGSTSSAAERGSWNTQAFKNFLDTNALGAGIGSTRASSIAMVALSNLGALGTATYALFFLGCVAAPFSEADPDLRAVRRAAGSACLATSVAACFAATSIDLGLMFFVGAALAAAPTLPARRRASPARGGGRGVGMERGAPAAPLTGA